MRILGVTGTTSLNAVDLPISNRLALLDSDDMPSSAGTSKVKVPTEKSSSDDSENASEMEKGISI